MHYLDYNENRPHGTGDFPVEFYHVDTSHPRYAMPYHWHPEYEIIRIINGNFTFYLNSEEINATAGDVLFIQDGVIHGGIPYDCVYECIVFDLQMLMGGADACRNIVRQIHDHRLCITPVFRAGSSAAQLTQALDRVFAHAAEDRPGQALCLTGSLCEVLGHLLNQGLILKNQSPADQDSHKRRQKLELFRSVIHYIEENYASSITLDQLSAQAGMSPKYFCRFFESIVHKTPVEYLNYYRVERACCELADTDASVTEIGYNCGFHDTSYFIRIFKREKGMTPREYRKELC